MFLSLLGRTNARNLFCVIMAAGLIVSPAVGAVKTAEWVGGGAAGSYNDPANWDIAEVPVDTLVDTYIVNLPGSAVTFDVPGLGNEVFQLNLPVGGSLVMNAGREIEVTDSAAISGVITNTAGSGSFVASSVASLFGPSSARINVAGSGTVQIGATGTYSTPKFYAAILSVDGAGSLLDLSSLQTIDAGWDDVWSGTRSQNITASNNGAMDLSGVTQIIAPLRAEDRLDIIVNNDGADNSLIDLSGLQTLSSARDGDTLFDIAADVNLALANLTTASNVQFDLDTDATLTVAGLTSHDLGSYALASGAAVNAPVLTAMTNVSLTLANGSQFDGSASLVDISGGTVTLSHPTQQFLHDTLSSVDARLLISGGSVFAGAADAEYDARSLAKSATIISSDGAGSEVNLPSVQTINAGWDDVWSGSRNQVISADNGGTVDFSGVTQIIAPIRVEDRLDIIVNNDGANNSLIDLSGLQTLSSARDGDTLFDIAADVNLPLSNLTTASNAQFDLDTNAKLTFAGLASHDLGSYALASGAAVDAPVPH
jgi:hypothetical protein